jgi:zinc finger protein
MAKERQVPSEAGAPKVSSEDKLMLGSREASYTQARCPACDSPKAVFRTVGLDVPFFGEVLETIFLCAACGFKHADTMLPKRSAPTEYSIEVRDDGDLFVRAVKSSSATVAVPEFGLLWEPGPASESQVTNVEGLLRRFEDALHRAMTLYGDDETQARGAALIEKIEAVIDGRARATVVMRDPYGNSALLDDRGRVTVRELAAKEAAELLTGEYVIDIEDGRPAGLRKVESKGPR